MKRIDPSEFIPTSDSTSEQWIEFHKALRKWFSKTESNNQWLRFWNQRAGESTDADDHTLRTYMDDQDVNLTTDTAGEISDSIWGISNWMESTATWLRAVVIGTVILAIALLAFYVYHKTKNGTPPTEISLGIPQRKNEGLGLEMLKYLV